jgi:hypothetical protein
MNWPEQELPIESNQISSHQKESEGMAGHEELPCVGRRNLKMSHHKKIAPKRERPFEIDKVLGPVTHQLKLPES